MNQNTATRIAMRNAETFRVVGGCDLSEAFYETTEPQVCDNETAIVKCEGESGMVSALAIVTIKRGW